MTKLGSRLRLRGTSLLSSWPPPYAQWAPADCSMHHALSYVWPHRHEVFLVWEEDSRALACMLIICTSCTLIKNDYTSTFIHSATRRLLNFCFLGHVLLIEREMWRIPCLGGPHCLETRSKAFKLLHLWEGINSDRNLFAHAWPWLDPCSGLV